MLTKEKSHTPNRQVKECELENSFKIIIAPGEDIDNNEIFNIITGETVRELRGI